jgi:hypothetical protein
MHTQLQKSAGEAPIALHQAAPAPHQPPDTRFAVPAASSEQHRMLSARPGGAAGGRCECASRARPRSSSGRAAQCGCVHCSSSVVHAWMQHTACMHPRVALRDTHANPEARALSHRAPRTRVCRTAALPLPMLQDGPQRCARQWRPRSSSSSSSSSACSSGELWRWWLLAVCAPAHAGHGWCRSAASPRTHPQRHTHRRILHAPNTHARTHAARLSRRAPRSTPTTPASWCAAAAAWRSR